MLRRDKRRTSIDQALKERKYYQHAERGRAMRRGSGGQKSRYDFILIGRSHIRKYVVPPTTNKKELLPCLSAQGRPRRLPACIFPKLTQRGEKVLAKSVTTCFEGANKRSSFLRRQNTSRPEFSNPIAATTFLYIPDRDQRGVVVARWYLWRRARRSLAPIP